MENQLFRKKSMDHISTPDDLRDYMRVTGPRLWVTLAAVIILMAGFIVYAATATMENVLPIEMRVDMVDSWSEEGEVVGKTPFCRVSLPAVNQDVVRTGMNVRIGEMEGRVILISMMDQAAYEEPVIELIIDMGENDPNLREGTYKGELILEKASPLSYLWN